MSTQPNTIR